MAATVAAACFASGIETLLSPSHHLSAAALVATADAYSRYRWVQDVAPPSEPGDATVDWMKANGGNIHSL
jgi:hypothetical protein